MGNNSLGVPSEVYKNQLRFHNLYLWNNWAELNLVRTFPFIHFEPLTKKKKEKKERNIEINCVTKKKKKTNLKFRFYFVCSDFLIQILPILAPTLFLALFQFSYTLFQVLEKPLIYL